jgi:hypothetical protein
LLYGKILNTSAGKNLISSFFERILFKTKLFVGFGSIEFLYPLMILIDTFAANGDKTDLRYIQNATIFKEEKT